MTDIEISEDEMREAAEEIVLHVDTPTMADAARAGDYLRAAAFARTYLTACDPAQEARLTPFRCLVLGYLAAVKDRL